MTKRKNDSDFGPGTVESDDDIENFSGSESEDEIKYRMMRHPNESDFYKDFTFVESLKDYQKDSWEEVVRYLKPNSSTSLTEKIAKIRLEKKEQNKKKRQENGVSKDGKELKDEAEDSDLDSDLGDTGGTDHCMEEFLPNVTKHDQFKLSEDEVRRKARRMGQPARVKKSLQETRQKEEDAKFFEDAPPCVGDSTFVEMNISRLLLKAIDNMGYDKPTPIQSATIPIALQGRDICGCASTGTGKTAAYMLPILERLLYKPKDDVVIRVLVLVPTRELGVQVFQVSMELAKFSNIHIALSVGGLDLRTQETELRKIPDIVIATPGRLLDHIKNTPTFNIDDIEILVLDEADRMLEDSFDDQMKEIIVNCSRNRQTMLFSATMTSKVKELALVSLKNPVKVFVNENTDVAQNLRQEFVRIRNNQEHYREAILAYLVSRSFSEHCMVFTGTKVMAHRLNIILGLLGVKCGELHGNLKQTDRLLTLKKFRDQEIGVLIATDVAARGLDIKGVKTVINFDLPSTYTRYVHRVGRTARAGYCGLCVNLAIEKEFTMLKEIKRCSKKALFSRVLNKEVLEKYKAKVEKVEPDVSRILTEERAEKDLLMMEQSIQKMKKKLKGTFEVKPERTWLETGESSNTKKNKAPDVADKQMVKGRAKKKRRILNAQDPEDKHIISEINMSDHFCKKANKVQRLKDTVKFRKFSNRDMKEKLKQAMPGVKGKRKHSRLKSSFDQELTRTDKKSVKNFRRGPSYSEKKAFQSENPKKRYNPRKMK
ncbi:probable ATP-dependent RNA helicase DDX27 [Panulirus ornatus]|uniref:probable ATP-dependent RNA helicase DDX27 n=1 Tax=Panulirus ornatus TaxID=150431 RepID=UPI003A8A04E0